MNYKVVIHDRNYTSWTYYDFDTFTEVNLPFTPLEKELFSNDVFVLSEQNVEIIKSTIRNSVNIPGILVLKNNRTFGRDTKGRLLYKCIPDDIRIPCFLIPYDIKNIGFSKIMENRYITFQFHHWDKKHPHAVIQQNIGTTDDVPSYYEYQLYCKSLNISIQSFTKDTSKALQKASHEAYISTIQHKYTDMEDRTAWSVFTIDPDNSVDFDDGFSIRECINDGCTEAFIHLSVYISNVSIWLETLQLWESFSRRIATIYLPDRKRPMLPTLLSEGLCSLQSGNKRFALAMDLFIDPITYELIRYEYKNVVIKVRRNFRYEEAALLSDPEYKSLLDIVEKMSNKDRYLPNIKDSHDVVAYLMILMNYKTAQTMKTFGNGIFRSVLLKKDALSCHSHIVNSLPPDITQFLRLWNSSSAEYIDYAKIYDSPNPVMKHDILNMDAYIHITSPIRRLVDLLNMIQLQENLGIIPMTKAMTDFYKKWTEDLEYINTIMRSIRRVQNDCTLLTYCIEHPDTMNKVYTGYLFDKYARHDSLFQYAVYLPEMKMVSRIVVRDDLDNYGSYSFRLYLFENEEKMKKKIRVQLITNT
jgi:exoribonuclease R